MSKKIEGSTLKPQIIYFPLTAYRTWALCQRKNIDRPCPFWLVSYNLTAPKQLVKILVTQKKHDTFQNDILGV